MIVDEFAAKDGKDHQYEIIYHTPIGWYDKNKPDVTATATKIADGMYWQVGEAEATMKGISATSFTADIVSGLNPANTDLTKETNGLGTERQMRGWLEGKIPTPTEIFSINGKNTTFFTVIAPGKKADDFQLGLVEGGKGVEVRFKNGDTHRLILSGAEGQPAISFTSPKTKATFTPQSNLDTSMDINGGALPPAERQPSRRPPGSSISTLVRPASSRMHSRSLEKWPLSSKKTQAPN